MDKETEEYNLYGSRSALWKKLTILFLATLFLAILICWEQFVKLYRNYLYLSVELDAAELLLSAVPAEQLVDAPFPYLPVSFDPDAAAHDEHALVLTCAVPVLIFPVAPWKSISPVILCAKRSRF